MRIMSLNGWGGKLYDALLPYVADEFPDVLCLQEVVHSPSNDADWLTYRDGAHVLAQRANFFRDVAEVLPEHLAVFCPAAQGVLWDGDISVPAQWGLASFIHKSLPVIGQGQGFVHKDYSPNGYGEHPRSRSAHAFRVYDHAGERAVTISHMHGLRDLKGKMDTPERLAQAHKFLALTQTVQQPDDVVVMCGDFNVEPDSETLKLLENAGMSELVARGGFEGTRNSYYKKPGRFADYMLVNDTSMVRSFDVVYDPEVSDHCPLMLEL